MSEVPTSATFKLIVKYVKENDGAFASEVSAALKVSIALASSYLKIAAQHGLLSMGHDKSSRGKLVRCYYAPGSSAQSVSDAEEEYDDEKLAEKATEKAVANIIYPSLIGLNTWGMVGFLKYGQPTTDF